VMLFLICIMIYHHVLRRKVVMNYKEFKLKYTTFLVQMMRYEPDQAGSNIYAEKLGALCDEYQEFEKKLDEED